MKNIFSKFESKVLPLMDKIARQKYLRAIRDSFLSLLPITLAGGITSVLTAAPVTENTTNGFILAWGKFAQNYGSILGWINTLTIGAMSLYLCLGITYYLAKHYNEEPFHPILLSLCGFLVLVVVPKELSFSSNLVDIIYIGGRGIIPAILISIITSELYHFMKKKNFGRIKMPDAVPEVLSSSFAILIPSIAIIFIFMLIFGIFKAFDTTLVEALYSALEPTFKAADNLVFLIFVTIITNLLFFFGIHDSAIVGFVGPIREGNLAGNARSKLAGESLEYVYTTPFWVYFVIIGGVGSALALGILLLRCKSKSCKYVGRLGLIPSFFGINEPLVFGLPVIFNPIFIIPFILAPTFNAILGYILMKAGLLSKTFAMLSWNMPNVFGVFLSTLDWKTIVFHFVCLFVNILIYYPFVRYYDNKQLEIEKRGSDKE